MTFERSKIIEQLFCIYLIRYSSFFEFDNKCLLSFWRHLTICLTCKMQTTVCLRSLQKSGLSGLTICCLNELKTKQWGHIFTKSNFKFKSWGSQCTFLWAPNLLPYHPLPTSTLQFNRENFELTTIFVLGWCLTNNVVESLKRFSYPLIQID